MAKNVARRRAGAFIAAQFDPILIAAQIACVQSLFYVSLGCLLLVADAATGVRLTMTQLFDPHSMSPSRDPRTWWAPALAMSVNAAVCACGLVFFVGKARKCLDFAATAHIVHVVASACFSGLRMGCIVWWFVLVAAAALMAVLGEFLCMKREMREIPLGTFGSASGSSSSATSSDGGDVAVSVVADGNALRV